VRLTTTVDLSGALTALRAIGTLKDETALLKRFDRYLRARTFDHFREEKGWPPLAKSTLSQTRALWSSGLTGNVAARNRLRAEASVRSKLTSALRRAGKRATEKTIAKRKAMIDEYEAYLVARAADPMAAALLDTKTLRSTKQRLGRAEERSARKLGRVRASIVSKIDASGLTVESRIPWAGVHNEGGTAGHGAKIPARPFLFFEAGDEQKMAEIVEGYVKELLR